MLTKQQLGYKFEDQVHELISQTYYPILREKEIIKKYGILCYGIDHLVYSVEYLICIQDKWRDTKSSLNDINHFLKSVEKVSEAENKRCIGIYLTKVPITKGGLEALKNENTKQTNLFLSINNEDMNLLLKKLSELFYSNQIYFYEPDGTTIMLD